MKLSVVVASYNAFDVLVDCVDALTQQPEASQIVVSDCSDVDPAPRLRERFPDVEFVHFDDLKTMPELRWAVLDRLDGDVIAALEARSIPAPDWCAGMLAAHRRYPDAAVVGGPVAHHPGAPSSELAMYFAEYAAYAPPVSVGPAPAVIEANLSYKRAALEEHRDFLATGEWESFLHGELNRTMSSAEVEFRHTGMALADLCGQRFYYGRNYAAARVEREGSAKAPLYAAGSVLLPVLLTYRDCRRTRSKPAGKLFLRAFPQLLFFNSLWAFGELTGYLFGPTHEKHIY